jgi:two-component system, chemotaxis family, protein-glutamate methylesterase/glutaminase
VAPPDHHLLAQPGHLCLAKGPHPDLYRPTIDLLFCTAARVYRNRVVGVLLSGMLDDGVAGLFAIRLRGGVTVVQDPEEARYPDMPRNAIANVAVDHILPAAEIVPLLTRLARVPRRTPPSVAGLESDLDGSDTGQELTTLPLRKQAIM